MPSHKINRAAEEIRRSLANIIRELKDPRIPPLLSIVRVDLAGDMSYAKIFVSAVEGLESATQAAEGLKSAKGRIKKELSLSVKIRKIPELIFIPDNSIEYGAHIAKMIEEF